MASPSNTSIKDRIAALNVTQLAHPPSYDAAVAAAGKKPPPPPPPKRQPATNVEQVVTNRHGSQASVVAEPAALNRRESIDSGSSSVLPPPVLARAGGRPSSGYVPESASPKPSLPPRLPSRRTSEAPQLPPSHRRPSTDSVSSVSTTRTTHSTISEGGAAARKLPPVFDSAALPTLPPKRTAEEKRQQELRDIRPGLRTARSSTSNVRQGSPPAAQSEAKPPSLPSRPSLPARPRVVHTNTSPQACEQTPPAKPPRRNILEMGFSNAAVEAPKLPLRPSSVSRSPVPSTPGVPPPVPLDSRPTLSAAQLASKPKTGANGNVSASSSGCLKCRDFSAADAHAARFPREAIPHLDVGGLAAQLTGPFQNDTDKARAIFTWLHHNVAYDVDAFFNNRVQPSTPDSTLRTGLAVCEGYGGLFVALALRAGLEALVVTGHGKGYGHAAMSPTDPVPPLNPTGHAWAAVRLPDSEGGWKLLDPCWGAGNVSGPGHPYQKAFKPSQFTMDNNEFGLSHFPEDARYFFRTDGRAGVSWEEYMRDGSIARPHVYGGDGGAEANGIAPRSFVPETKALNVGAMGGGGMVRFQFEKVCPHWDPVRNGEGPSRVFVLSLPTPSGDERMAFDTDGRFWWCDVPRGKLDGCRGPGKKVRGMCVTSFDGRDGRGLALEEFRRRDGRVAMGFGFLVEWDVV